MSSTKVIFNVLPPARIDTPSAALSALKGFLALHHIESRILYWNVLLDSLLPPFPRNTDDIHLHLLPYLYALGEEYGDDICKSKANAVIKAQLPLYDRRNDNSDYLYKVHRALEATIARQLTTIPGDAPLLFGLSCRYEQWIPGIILATRIKQFFPDARIVIGGISGADKAVSLLERGVCFDFAIWGEGEYPLLELCQALESGSPQYDSISRLVYRHNSAIRCSTGGRDRYHDLNRQIIVDHDDYFHALSQANKKRAAVIFPLESSRGCTWNRCRFCVYGDGHKTRSKNTEVLKHEINTLIEKYNARYFAFMDNDIAANEPKRLDTMLTELAVIRQQHDVHLIAEIIPKNISASTIKKLSRAGFDRIHFGYESLSDRLLRAMRKKTNFSDNLFFVKFCRKYKVKLPSANIICGVLGEEDADILACMDNLHFLRFFFDKNFFVHNMISLRVAKHSDFYQAIDAADLGQWRQNELYTLLPQEMTENVDRFALFDFSAPPHFLWEVFARLNTFYGEHRYEYSVALDDDRIVYREFFDGDPLVEYEIDKLEYCILRATNENILSLESLSKAVRQQCGGEEGDRSLWGALNRLKERHLVYFGEKMQSIVSIIDTDQLQT